MDVQALVLELTGEEGSRLKPYRDTNGKLTIGIGRNLDDVGISPAEEQLLCMNDINRAIAVLDREILWWRKLTENRQQAVADMCFNMGWGKLSQFKNMLGALQKGDFETAANEALNSAWSKEVGSRANTIANKIRNG